MAKHSWRRITAGAGILAIAATLAACGSSDPLAGGGGDSESADPKTIIIGSQGFPESDILGQLYGQVLAANGYTVSYEQTGNREIFVPALEDGSINFIPDYAGNLLYASDPDATATSEEDVAAALPDALDGSGLAVLDLAPAQDADALVVTPEFAAANNLVTIGDLAPIASTITLGANTEFEERPYGRAGLEAVYGITGYTFKAIDDFGGEGTLKDLLDNVIQVADIYTTTPSIAQNDLVVLEDPEHLIAAQNIVPLLNADLVTDEIADLLNPVSAALTTEDLLELNVIFGGDDKPSAEKVATDWLTEKGLL